MRGNYDYLGSDSATYDGSLQNGTPITMSTRERISKAEFDLGIKIWNDRGGTLAVYGGYGYRWWDRGVDALPDYKEKYTWGYGVAGANVAWRITPPFVLALDVAFLWPVSPEMKTDIAGLVDDTTFKIKSELSYRVQLPATYDIYTTKGCKVYAYLTPYFEQWNIGQSPVVSLNQGGVPTGLYAVEPKSHSDI